MAQITLRLDDDLLDALDTEADEEGVSRSQHIRDTLATRGRADELQREVAQTEARVEDLRRQLQEATKDDRDLDEIVTYVEDERRMQQHREERRERRESAPAWRRAKWWLFGYNGTVETDEDGETAD